jgi:DNA-binding Lrp family transcriptional regulator
MRLRRAFLVQAVPKFGSIAGMIDRFDRALLNIVQADDSRTAEALAERVPLSPSAIARRLRRLRSDGWIARTIALLSPQLTGRRLRALVFIQLAEHADQRGKERLQRRLNETPEVQFAYEISGNHDLAVLLDCPSMDDFVALAEELFASDSSVHRYETSFVKREVKFAPFVDLDPVGD